MEIDLGQMKTYLRVDGSEDDPILTLLISAAKEYLINAGIPEQESAQYTLAVWLYCAMHHEHRDPTKKVEKFSLSFEGVIQQLKAGGLAP